MDRFTPPHRFRNNHYQYYSRNHQRQPFQYILRTHFENIQMLASIIQESQCLLTHERMFTPSSSPSPSPSQGPTYVVQMDSLFSNTTPPTVSPQTDISFTTQTIDASDTLFSTSADIIEVNEYRYISNPINEMCPITRESFYLNQPVSMIRNCRHIFNKEALHIWLRSNNTCPTCRASIHG